MITGALVVAFFLIILGWSKDIVSYFATERETIQTYSIALAVASIYALDFAINAGESNLSSFGFSFLFRRSLFAKKAEDISRNLAKFRESSTIMYPKSYRGYSANPKTATRIIMGKSSSVSWSSNWLLYRHCRSSRHIWPRTRR